LEKAEVEGENKRDIIKFAFKFIRMARWLIITGIILIVIGLLLHYAPAALNWFGRLPGDIRIENERTRVYIPITSMIVISVVLSVLIRLFRNFS
jgi:H+/Cl- antiporter ClcA